MDSMNTQAARDTRLDYQSEDIPAAEIEYPFNRSRLDAPAGLPGER